MPSLRLSWDGSGGLLWSAEDMVLVWRGGEVGRPRERGGVVIRRAKARVRVRVGEVSCKKRCQHQGEGAKVLVMF